jgi:hypothetical protein
MTDSRVTDDRKGGDLPGGMGERPVLNKLWFFCFILIITFAALWILENCIPFIHLLYTLSGVHRSNSALTICFTGRCGSLCVIPDGTKERDLEG